MTGQMPPRFQQGSAFFDTALYNCYRQMNYPEAWLDEGLAYAPKDAYVISHPTWFFEAMPPVPEISIYELFSRTAANRGDDTAVIFLDKPASYRQLHRMIGQYAALLKDLGIEKGDVVAAMLPNSIQHIIAFYGAAMIGAVHTPVNVMYQAEEVAYQIRDAGARAVLILDLLADRVQPLVEDNTIKQVITTHIRDWAADDAVVSNTLKMFWDIPKSRVAGALDFFSTIEKYPPLTAPAAVDARTETALLLYTAGTTGKSKGVIETHFNLVFNSLTHTHAFRAWGDHEVNFSIMPMFHTAGYFLHLLPTLYQGGTVIPVVMFDLADAFRVIETNKVNVIFAPPTFFIAMMSDPELIGSHDLTSLAVTIGCGAPVPVAVQNRWQQTTGVKLVNGWGMTETNSGGIISIPGIKEKDDAIGIPVFSEVKIVDEKANIVGRNQEGEICYRGLQLARGYLNKPAETIAAFMPDGWFHTGDRGYVDEADFVHFVDRIKDLIVASGYNIAPVEVEDVLYRHPGVAEAAVVGIADTYRGESVKAVIAPKPEYKDRITEQEIIDLCKTHLATFKVPRTVEFRDSLPKNAVGKILRRMLRD
ncbi:MAG: AMP-binding protein [Desulfosalsimonas sp.]|uniref:class I adenylate-forming enzyme family protein n=1 Tax=Desulfosalsimonas sp. TaxID=3073848 RepID=UPI0039706E00